MFLVIVSLLLLRLILCLAAMLKWSCAALLPRLYYYIYYLTFDHYRFFDGSPFGVF